jgi:hypothetical protein
MKSRSVSEWKRNDKKGRKPRESISRDSRWSADRHLLFNVLKSTKENQRKVKTKGEKQKVETADRECFKYRWMTRKAGKSACSGK